MPTLEDLFKEIGTISSPSEALKQAGYVSPLLSVEHLEEIREILTNKDETVVNGFVRVMSNPSLVEDFFRDEKLFLLLDDFLTTNQLEKSIEKEKLKRLVPLINYVTLRMVLVKPERLIFFIMAREHNCYYLGLSIKINKERIDSLRLLWQSGENLKSENIEKILLGLVDTFREESLCGENKTILKSVIERNAQVHISQIAHAVRSMGELSGNN